MRTFVCHFTLKLAEAKELSTKRKYGSAASAHGPETNRQIARICTAHLARHVAYAEGFNMFQAVLTRI